MRFLPIWCIPALPPHKLICSWWEEEKTLEGLQWMKYDFLSLSIPTWEKEALKTFFSSRSLSLSSTAGTSAYTSCFSHTCISYSSSNSSTKLTQKVYFSKRPQIFAQISHWSFVRRKKNSIQNCVFWAFLTPLRQKMWLKWILSPRRWHCKCLNSISRKTLSHGFFTWLKNVLHFIASELAHSNFSTISPHVQSWGAGNTGVGSRLE